MAVAATGFFDGVHLGHRHVLGTLVNEARHRGDESLVLTFWPHPRTVLHQDDGFLRLLTTRDEKSEMLSSIGVDRIETLPFTTELASMDGEEYLLMLVERFGVKCVVIGYDTRIGCDQLGPDEIEEVAGGMGLELVRVAEFSRGHVLSSTRIRQALEGGRVEEAASMLGYRYSISGIVVPGNRLGRTLGYPTANMQPDDALKAVPGNGAYLTESMIDGRSIYGMTNIGVRPTVCDGSSVTIETHLFDFDEDIYGAAMTVSFIARVRDERKFGNIRDLVSQLDADGEYCRKIITEL